MMTPGQAPRRAWHLVWRLFLWVVTALPMLVGLAAGVLIWRLSTGPVESHFLARQIEAAANQAHAGYRVSIGRAAIAWEGWHGDGAPLDIRLSGVVLRNLAGEERGRLPDASITLALGPLMRGVLAPAAIELTRPSLFLIRDLRGAIGVDVSPTTTPRDPPGLTPAPTPEEAMGDLLADLMGPAEERAIHTSLRRIRVTGGEVSLRDTRYGSEWMLRDAFIELRRLPRGGVEGDGEATLRLGGVDIPVHLIASIHGTPARFSVRFDLPVLRPSAVAGFLPPLAPLAMLDAPVAIQVTGEFDATGNPLGFDLRIFASEGGDLRLDGRARLPFKRLSARLTGDGRRLALEEAVLELADEAGSDQRPMLLTADGNLARNDEGWLGDVRASVERLQLGELSRLWPEGLAPEAREAVRLALPQGYLEEATLRLRLGADADLTSWLPLGGSLSASVAQARLLAPDGAGVDLQRAELHVEASPTRLAILALNLQLPPTGRPSSQISATGAADLREGRWRGALDLSLDRVSFADLAVLWPQGLGGGARAWITANIPTGDISNGRWRFEAEGASGPGWSGAEAELTGLSGEAEFDGAQLYWLRPIAAARGVSGRARFGLREIAVEVASGRQSLESGSPGSLELRPSTLRFLLPADGVPRAEFAINLAGGATDAIALLRHPRLKLFDRRPFPVQVAAGRLEGRINLGFPLLADIPNDALRVNAEARVSQARFTRLLFERDLEDANFEMTVDPDQMRLNGTAVLNTVPLRLAVEMDFRPGPPTQIVARETITARPDAVRIAQLGFDMGGIVSGPVAIEARTERRRNGQYAVTLRGDLRDAVMNFTPLGWTKPAGSPGRADAVLRLQGDQLTSVENIRVEALELSLRARAVARGGRVERVELQETAFGASRMVGDARAPSAPGGPWAVTLRGPVLDLRSIFGPAGHQAGGAARDRDPAPPPTDTSQPPLSLDVRFDQVMLAPGRDVFAVQARGRLDAAGVLREANLRARTARQGGAFEITMTPRGEARQLRGTAEDGGALLRAMGLIETINGGRLQVTGEYAESRPGSPLTGTAELDNFTVRNAPALGKLLQAMTLFGLVEAVQGGSGLVFSRAVVPFSLSPQELRINDARAFSASLGLTARGRVLRERVILDLDGTIVPAYFFNTLLGNLPLVGRLFSPETGGGVFAATFRAQGPPDDAEISVNPLALVTPGFLRGMFGLAETGRPAR